LARDPIHNKWPVIPFAEKFRSVVGVCGPKCLTES
jgi:hypothetical protein